RTPDEQKQAREENDAKRHRQAEHVREIVHDRFRGKTFDSALFAVLGDFNDEPASPAVDPLLRDAGLVSALERIPVALERWTYWYRSENTVAPLDHVLLSPALAKATEGTVPTI